MEDKNGEDFLFAYTTSFHFYNKPCISHDHACVFLVHFLYMTDVILSFCIPP